MEEVVRGWEMRVDETRFVRQVKMALILWFVLNIAATSWEPHPIYPVPAFVVDNIWRPVALWWYR